MLTNDECISCLHDILDKSRPLLDSYAKIMVENNDIHNRYECTIIDGVRVDELQWLLYDVSKILEGGNDNG